MKNILIFTPFALENGRGGEISAIELAAGLKKFYNITIIDTNQVLGKKLLPTDIIKNKLIGVMRYERIKFAMIKIFRKNFNFPYPLEILKLYKIIRRNHIVYFSVHEFKMSIIFILINLLNQRIKYIIGFRKPLFSEKKFSLYNLKYRLSILSFTILNRNYYYHTISYHAKKFLENFYDPQRINHIIHGIELDNFINESKEKITNKKLKFLYVGQLDDPHKGFGVLLKTIEQLLIDNTNLNLFFEFCGVGPLEQKLKSFEKEYPQYIKYHGYVSNDKIAEYYKKNDVFLFSSRREPFGRVLIEALASSLLILCTKTFGSNEILKNKEFAFFIKELTPELIKKKILKIYNLWINNPDKIKELQRSARSYAIKNFSFSRELGMFNKFIQKIIRQ